MDSRDNAFRGLMFALAAEAALILVVALTVGLWFAWT